MPSFRYRAVNAAGRPVTGALEASSSEAAIEHLQSVGNYPTSIMDAAGSDWRGWLKRQLVAPGRASSRDLGLATHELATLLHAGLALDRAIETVAGLGKTRRLRQPLSNVVQRIRSGSTPSAAFAAEAPIFPPLYVNMVRAGEAGGQLEAAFVRLAEYLGRAYERRQALRSALVYPVVLLATAGLAMAVNLVVVVPQFEPLFREAGRELPAATRAVAGIGKILAAYWPLLLSVAAAATWAARHALRRPGMRRRWHALLLRIPALGKLLTRIDTERFTRALAALLANGVSLPTALGIAKDTLGNGVIAAAVEETAASLREGEKLADRLARTGVFPDMAVDLVRIGEESGRLPEMLLHQANFYETEIRYVLDRMMALLVPAVTLVLGALVAALIASMLVAVLSINDLALQ
jgi:general secretion pathway protein F